MIPLKHYGLACFFAICVLLAPSTFAADQAAKTNPKVSMATSLGVIELELYPDKAPDTVENFLQYVKAGHYDGMIFHRVIKKFMIQGGGFLPGMKERHTRMPVMNEATNGLPNKAGTIAMARTVNPHSATDQFFINTVDNAPLDHRGKTPTGWGYAVFGRVTKGMDVVKKIENVATTTRDYYDDVPLKDVLIEKVTLLGAKP